jgi:hypothetical protein
MQVIPGEKNEGVRLVVNETVYTGSEQAGREIVSIEQNPTTPPTIHYRGVEAGSQSFVLADRLAYCRFSYLELRYEAPFRVWRTDFPLVNAFPMAVRIEMAPLDQKPGELHVTTVTVPFALNGIPGTNYADYTPPPPQ